MSKKLITSSRSGRSMMELLKKLWPLHRTLNSDDTEHALEICGNYLKNARWKLHRFPPKKDVYTWYIPERYKVKEAWLEINGERLADFSSNPLHLLSYSLPMKIDGKLGDIRDHLWTNPDRPNAIPWEFKYYERTWGFCLKHNDLIRFDDNSNVRGIIDVSFDDDEFCLGEFYLPGESNEDILFITNICHPSQVNDSISGLVVGLEMARNLIANPSSRHYGFRLLVVPETIGTIAWLSENEDKAAQIKFAWFCEIVGHDNSFILQRSRQENSLIDKAMMSVLRSYRKHGVERSAKFREAVASDEMVTNGPGFDIPTPSLSRWPYPEYHTSDDTPDIISEDNLIETLNVLTDLHAELENNYYPKRKFKGPIMLSRYGLWVDWRIDRDLNLATEKIMLMLEGNKSLIDISYELELPLSTVRPYVDRLLDAGLVEKKSTPWDELASKVGN